MTENKQVSIPDIIRNLAGGISAASEVQNAYWLALAVASVFVMLPKANYDKDNALISFSLPFSLPEVPPAWFGLVSVLLLSGLTVAFCAAQANLIRSETLARGVLEEYWQPTTDVEATPAVEMAREYLDALRKPSLTLASSLWSPVDTRICICSSSRWCSLYGSGFPSWRLAGRPTATATHSNGGRWRSAA